MEVDVPNVVKGGGVSHFLALLAGQAGMRAPGLPVLVRIAIGAAMIVRAVQT